MRPGTLHYGLTITPSIFASRNFDAMSTMLDSVWAHIHSSILDSPLTNTTRKDTSVFFIQIQAYWFVNFKRICNGNLFALRLIPGLTGVQGRQSDCIPNATSQTLQSGTVYSGCSVLQTWLRFWKPWTTGHT
jgi:hypothetical protein